MPIEIGWDNDEKTVLLLQVIGDWTLSEYYEYYLKAKAMMDTVDHPLCLILDMTETKVVPSRMMSTASFSKKHRAENVELSIFVGASMFVKVLADTMATIVSPRQRRLRFANTVEEAREIVVEHEQSRDMIDK